MKRLLGLFFVVSVAGGWFMLSEHPLFVHKKHSVAANTPVPDGYMTDAHLIQYDAKGELRSSLHTPKMTHYHEDNTSYFDHPKVIAYSTQHAPWEVNAQFGKAIHDGDQVDLWGGVVIHQPSQSKKPETFIQTESMTVYPHRSYAVTNQQVTFTRPDAQVTALGMEAYFKLGIFKLISTARGTYVPSYSR